jgi:hypothetical protein
VRADVPNLTADDSCTICGRAVAAGNRRCASCRERLSRVSGAQRAALGRFASEVPSFIDLLRLSDISMRIESLNRLLSEISLPRATNSVVERHLRGLAMIDNDGIREGATPDVLFAVERVLADAANSEARDEAYRRWLARGDRSEM